VVIDTKYFILFILLIRSSFIFAQVPQEEKKLVRIAKEVWVGATLHSNGFGFSFNKSKFKTHKIKSLLNVELLSMKHDKEYKIYGKPDENAKKYVYGKLNSLYIARLGFGRRKILIEKLREKGLQFAINWSSGASFGFVKPIYLEILKYDVDYNFQGISLEKYNSDIHSFEDIFGRGRWSAGLPETTINPGVYYKAGVELDYSNEREIINSLEIGMAIDVFLLPIKLMVENNSQNFFPTIYINFSIGNKYY
tara:strand:+ start:135 stop:887 length:753 start_codon:yes stop_codon:yes gene_type:complete